MRSRRAKIAKNPDEIVDLLKEGYIVISEGIIQGSSHCCVNGTHVYTLGEKRANFIEERFPKLKLVQSGLVCIFCSTEDGSLQSLCNEISL